MKYVITLLMAAVMSGCAATLALDTVNKRFAAFEVTYQEALKTALNLRDSGHMDLTTEEYVTSAIKKIEVARTAAYAALKAGDAPLAESHLKVAQSILLTLSELIKQQRMSNEQRDSSIRLSYRFS